MATNPKDRTVDVEEQIFWKEIKEAVKHVELNHGLSFSIEYGTKSATVYYSNYTDDRSMDFVFVGIYEVEPKQPTLMVP